MKIKIKKTTPFLQKEFKVEEGEVYTVVRKDLLDDPPPVRTSYLIYTKNGRAISINHKECEEISK